MSLDSDPSCYPRAEPSLTLSVLTYATRVVPHLCVMPHPGDAGTDRQCVQDSQWVLTVAAVTAITTHSGERLDPV